MTRLTTWQHDTHKVVAEFLVGPFQIQKGNSLGTVSSAAVQSGPMSGGILLGMPRTGTYTYVLMRMSAQAGTC